MKLAVTSVILLGVQLAIVSSVAGKYLYQRLTCPKVWTRTVAYDPELVMRGRYLSVRLVVDGCASTLDSAKQTVMPKDKDGLPMGKKFSIQAGQPVEFTARIKAENGKLVAIRIPESDSGQGGQMVDGRPGSSCDEMQLNQPVDFYLAEHAQNPVGMGQELWVEVTVPPKGPPRPIQLALKDHGVWKPLAFQ